MEEDELAQANSEMRFLTLELMKVAAQRKQRFKEVLGEFIQNVYTLEATIRKKALKRSRRRAKKLARQPLGSRARQHR